MRIINMICVMCETWYSSGKSFPSCVCFQTNPCSFFQLFSDSNFNFLSGNFKFSFRKTNIQIKIGIVEHITCHMPSGFFQFRVARLGIGEDQRLGPHFSHCISRNYLRFSDLIRIQDKKNVPFERTKFQFVPWIFFGLNVCLKFQFSCHFFTFLSFLLLLKSPFVF